MQIAFVGDVMLGRLVNDRLRTADPAYPWGDTLPILRRADLRIANLECVLADGGAPEPGKVFTFRSDLKNVHALAAAGIDAVSLANNHVLDYGADAFREMLPALDAAGILHAGAGEDLAAAQRPAVLRAGGTAVGFVAFTDNEPDWDATARSPGVHYVPVAGPEDRAERLLELVRETSSGVQLVIVSAHWGGNWGSEPLPEHRALARRLVDAGADVVFGHSPPHRPRRRVLPGPARHLRAGDFIDDYAVDPVERNDRSFIFLLEADDGAPNLLRLFPTVIAGCQARLARGDARGSTARMARLCAALGTAGRWSARDGCLELRPR